LALFNWHRQELLQLLPGTNRLQQVGLTKQSILVGYVARNLLTISQPMGEEIMTFNFTLPDSVNIDNLNADSITADMPANFSLNHITLVFLLMLQTMDKVT
jgi:hypothetical protein